MTSPIDDGLGFFAHLSAVEAEVYSGLLVDDLDMMDEIALRRKLKPLLSGKPDRFIELPSRRAAPTPEWLEAERARQTGPRTAFAAQVVSAGDDTLVVIYCSDHVINTLGMWNRFAVGFVGDYLMAVSREVRCGDCGGRGCGRCQRRGWLHVAGRELGELTVKETRRLVAPTDATSQALYEAMS